MRAQAARGIDFDPEALRAFLDRAVDGGSLPLAIERVGGGQSNPTYFLSRGDARLVLRKPPATILVKSAHDVAREFRIITALSGTDVPVPEPILMVDDASVIGTPFYLMRRVMGVVHLDADLGSLPPENRRRVYLAHARLMAALHALDPVQIGLGDLIRPGSFTDRQVRRWCDAWGDERSKDVGRLRKFLESSRPESEHKALIHGDFKLNNIVVDAAGEQILSVLDWELAAVGDPLLDVAHAWASTWETSPNEYGGILGLDLQGTHLPTIDEWYEQYVTAGGARGGQTPFYRALALLRYAGIFRGVGQRAAAGVATSADAAKQSALAHVYLDRALLVIDQT